MPPKKIYSNQRFAQVGAESAAKARATYQNSFPMELSCEHLPEFDKAFCQNDGKLRRDTPLTFRWRVKCAGYEATHDVNARCNHVTERGVPLPEHWRTAMQCLTLEARAEASTGDMRETGVSQVRCEVLGQARILEPSCAESEEPETGKIIALRTGESRVMFFLCAHVHGNEWLCHRGSFVDGALAENPFQEKDLFRKDIVAETWNANRSKRLRSDGQRNILRRLVQSSDYSWCVLVAVAQYRAEDLRAELQGSAMDEDVAKRGFK